jgi:hypothetical protein
MRCSALLVMLLVGAAYAEPPGGSRPPSAWSAYVSRNGDTMAGKLAFPTNVKAHFGPNTGTAIDVYFDGVNGNWNGGNLVLTGGGFIANPGNVSTITQITTSGNSSMKLSGTVINGGSAVAVKIGNANALSTAGAHVEEWYSDNFATRVAYVDQQGGFTGAGALTLASGTPYATTSPMPAGEIVQNNGTVDAPGIHFYTGADENMGIDATHSTGLRFVTNLDDVSSGVMASISRIGTVYGNGGTNPLPAVHSTQTTNPVSVEFFTQALTAGAATKTFATAFSAAPVCGCTDQTAAAAVKATPTTSNVALTGTSTDVVGCICMGPK